MNSSLIVQVILICYGAIWLATDISLTIPPAVRGLALVIPLVLVCKVQALMAAPGISSESGKGMDDLFIDSSPGPNDEWFKHMRTDPYGLARARVLFALPRELDGKPCAVCHAQLTAPVALCRACETAAHEGCWRFAKGCMRYGCAPRAADPLPKPKAPETVASEAPPAS